MGPVVQRIASNAHSLGSWASNLSVLPWKKPSSKARGRESARRGSEASLDETGDDVGGKLLSNGKPFEAPLLPEQAEQISSNHRVPNNHLCLYYCLWCASSVASRSTRAMTPMRPMTTLSAVTRARCLQLIGETSDYGERMGMRGFSVRRHNRCRRLLCERV